MIVCIQKNWSQSEVMKSTDTTVKKIVSKNKKYILLKEVKAVSFYRGQPFGFKATYILKNSKGIVLWERQGFMGEPEEIIELDNGKAEVIFKYDQRKIRINTTGKIIRPGDKYDKQLVFKNEFDTSRPEIQTIDNKTGKIIKEFSYENVDISDDGQYFVIFESTFTYKKETLEAVAKIDKFIEENAATIKRGETPEPSYEFSEQDIEKRELYLSLHDVNSKLIWKKKINLIGELPCCPTIEKSNGDRYIYLHQQDLDIKRKFDNKGIEIGLEKITK